MKQFLVVAALLFAGHASAQETAVYRLSFALHETENGKSASARNYSMLISPQSSAKLSTGTKLPVPSGRRNQQVYLRRCWRQRARQRTDRGSQLLLNAGIEVSNLGAGRDNAGPRAAAHRNSFAPISIP